MLGPGDWASVSKYSNLMHDPQTIEARMPVWSALSEFFLDTDLQEDDYQRIASVLARSAYSIAEVEEILRYEVYPPLRSNLLSIAGEWAGFDEQWLCEKISPHTGKRPRLRLPQMQWGRIRHHWERVSELIQNQR